MLAYMVGECAEGKGALKKMGRCKIAESKLGCVTTRDVNSTLHSQWNANLGRAFLERRYA